MRDHKAGSNRTLSFRMRVRRRESFEYVKHSNLKKLQLISKVKKKYYLIILWALSLHQISGSIADAFWFSPNKIFLNRFRIFFIWIRWTFICLEGFFSFQKLRIRFLDFNQSFRELVCTESLFPKSFWFLIGYEISFQEALILSKIFPKCFKSFIQSWVTICVV